MNIWYFAKPTIGYCPDCDEEATLSKKGVGLECPICGNANPSIFVWDESSRHPEEE